MSPSLVLLQRANPPTFLPELSNWLINAFNGEWLAVADAKPKGQKLPTSE
jgi:hypothetical protein